MDDLLTNPRGFIHGFHDPLGSWDQPRRVVAKIEWHVGAMFSRVGFIVTNLNQRSKNVVTSYNGRGTVE